LRLELAAGRHAGTGHARGDRSARPGGASSCGAAAARGAPGDRTAPRAPGRGSPCIVAGRRATTVVVGAALPRDWARLGPLIERSISSLHT
jgi:hypothetical protein